MNYELRFALVVCIVILAIWKIQSKNEKVNFHKVNLIATCLLFLWRRKRMDRVSFDAFLEQISEEVSTRSRSVLPGAYSMTR